MSEKGSSDVWHVCTTTAHNSLEASRNPLKAGIKQMLDELATNF